MATLCSYQDVLDRVGPYANSDIIASEAIVDRYIETAEQTIVAETKISWVDGYASVPDSVKATLKICAATHAAVDIISDDMSGFTSTAEAITMLNVNETRFQRTLKALRDLDIVKIRSVS